MMKDSKKYPVELDNYECSLILNNAPIFGQLKATLTRMSKQEGIHTIQMTLADINEIARWMAAESNHARSQRKSEELGDLCDHLENIIYKRKK